MREKEKGREWPACRSETTTGVSERLYQVRFVFAKRGSSKSPAGGVKREEELGKKRRKEEEVVKGQKRETALRMLLSPFQVHGNRSLEPLRFSRAEHLSPRDPSRGV